MDSDGHGGGCVEYVCFPPTWQLLERPVLRPASNRSTQQSDRQHIGAVKVSLVLIDVTPEPVEEPVLTGTTGDDGDTEYMSAPVWQTVLGSGLSVREEAVPGVDCCDSMFGEPISACLDSVVGFMDLAGGVTVGVMAPANLSWGCYRPSDSPGRFWVASLADAGVASLTHLAEGVTVRVSGIPGRCWGGIRGGC